MPKIWTDEQERQLQQLLEQSEQPRGALLPALSLAQSAFGTLDREALQLVADSLPLSLAEVMEVAHFYDSYATTPRGQHHVRVCRGLSCMLQGAGGLLRLCQRSQEQWQANHTDATQEDTPLPPWSWSTTACFSLCDKAAVVQLDETFHTAMTSPRLASLMEEWD